MCGRLCPLDLPARHGCSPTFSASANGLVPTLRQVGKRDPNMCLTATVSHRICTCFPKEQKYFNIQKEILQGNFIPIS